MCALAVILTASGAGAELLGIFLVARDIRAARRRARQAVIAPQESYEPARPRPPIRRTIGTAYDIANPTLEKRVQVLEEKVDQLGERLGKEASNLDQRLIAAVDGAADAIAADAHRRDEAMRAFLRDLLTADLRSRIVGTGLIGAGIVLSLTGTLIGLASC